MGAFAALLGFVFALGGCVSDADCRNDCACQQLGRCGAKGNKCQPTREEHCREAQNCQVFGTCSLGDGRCVAKSEADCQASTHCKSGGVCSLKGDRCSH